MADNGKAKSLYDDIYDDIIHCSPFVKLQRIASQLSELIHCHTHRKVGDEYVLSMLCAMRNAIWDSEDSDNSNWHTGTPTEEGVYVIKVGNRPYFPYILATWVDGEWLTKEIQVPIEDYVKWQKINEGGEE